MREKAAEKDLGDVVVKKVDMYNAQRKPRKRVRGDPNGEKAENTRERTPDLKIWVIGNAGPQGVSVGGLGGPGRKEEVGPMGLGGVLHCHHEKGEVREE